MNSNHEVPLTRQGEFSAPEFDEIQGERIVGSFSTDPDAWDNMVEEGIENSEIIGVFDSAEEPLISEIKNSRIHGDIDAQGLLNHAENSVGAGGYITTENALNNAEESLILGDTVQITKGSIGNTGYGDIDKDREGNVIAGRDVTLGPKKSDKLEWTLQEFHPQKLFEGNDIGTKMASPVIEVPESLAQSVSYAFDLDVMWSDGQRALGVETPDAEGMPVISEGSHPDENVTEYHGDWDELSEYLTEKVPEGEFRGFDVFSFPDRIDDLEHLDEVVREVGQNYSEVEEESDDVERVINRYDLPPLQGTNQEIFERIKRFKDLSEFGEEIRINAFDDPNLDEIVYEISSSDHVSTTSKMQESPEALKKALEQSPLESQEAAATFNFLDAPEPENAEELLYELKAREMIGSEVGEAYEFVEKVSGELEIEVPWEAEGYKSQVKNLIGLADGKDQREIYDWLKAIEEDPVKILSDSSINISEDEKDEIREGNTEYLIRNAGRAISDRGKLSSLVSNILGSERENEDFLTSFKGGNSERVLEPGFSSTKFTDGEDALDSREEAIDAAYSEGVELLNRISAKQGNFSVDHPEIEELEEELDQTIEQISNSQGRPSEELIQRKNRLKSKIPEKRREVAFNDLGLDYGEDTDYSDLNPGELRQVLDQLGQEYLEGEETNPETDAGKASDIAGRIDMSDEVGNGYIDFEVYDKDIMNLPSDDRRVPCTFPGGARDGEFIDYMKDPGTQIALLESGEDNGAVISHPVKQEGQDYLLIHSVESNDGITSRNDVSMAIREQIEEYASEADMEGVIYSTSSHNTAAEDFIEAAVQQDPAYQEQTYTVDKKGDQDVHLDFDLPEVQGYKVEI